MSSTTVPNYDDERQKTIRLIRWLNPKIVCGVLSHTINSFLYPVLGGLFMVTVGASFIAFRVVSSLLFATPKKDEETEEDETKKKKKSD